MPELARQPADGVIDRSKTRDTPFHGRSPLFEICNDLILAQSMPSGAVHPKHPLLKFGSEFSMTGGGASRQFTALHHSTVFGC